MPNTHLFSSTRRRSLGSSRLKLGQIGHKKVRVCTCTRSQVYFIRNSLGPSAAFFGPWLTAGFTEPEPYIPNAYAKLHSLRCLPSPPGALAGGDFQAADVVSELWKTAGFTCWAPSRCQGRVRMLTLAYISHSSDGDDSFTWCCLIFTIPQLPRPHLRLFAVLQNIYRHIVSKYIKIVLINATTCFQLVPGISRMWNVRIRRVFRFFVKTIRLYVFLCCAVNLCTLLPVR